jgi:hypothetical protein
VNVVKMVSLEFLVFRDHLVHVVSQVKVVGEGKVCKVHLDNQDLLDHQ